MLTDSDTTAELQRRMSHAVSQLTRMAAEVAEAKQVKEFNSDRMKRAFSVLVVEQLNNPPNSAISAAEHRARASDAWGAQLNDLSGQYKSAIRVLEQYEAYRTQYEAARSLLAMEREKARL